VTLNVVYDDDARFGNGVYFTSLAPPPATSKEDLEENNYGGDFGRAGFTH